MSRSLVAVAVALALALPGRAGAGDLWSERALGAAAEVAQRAYDRAMLEGDEALDLAIAEQVPGRRRKYVDRAILAYETAARALPSAAEPHFRAASALHAFFIDCETIDQPAALCKGASPSPHVVKRLVDHWDAFEAKAPLDPRLTEDILFARAILHTRAATPESLDAARRDYKLILSRRQPGRGLILVLGNLAETEMMLGDLDASITTYRRVLEIDQRKENYFGLAVALDRDEQGEEARAILRSLGPKAVDYLYNQIKASQVFYVPDGEQYYYLALGAEAAGLPDDAIRLYDAFIMSGAHPRYAPRAKVNRDALAARLKRGR